MLTFLDIYENCNKNTTLLLCSTVLKCNGRFLIFFQQNLLRQKKEIAGHLQLHYILVNKSISVLFAFTVLKKELMQC